MQRPQWAGLSFFALLVTAAPLAFGAVDRLVQIALVSVFVLALAVAPPVVPKIRGWIGVAIVALAALLVFKEFAPGWLFGSTEWRDLLSQQYGMRLPPTHHPEPGRAVDALLTVVLAGVWLLWVRTLTAHRSNCAVLTAALLASGAIVAAVSFLTAGIDAKAIYGLRFTQSWSGFGPFPNRNHTACFLAISAVAGAGCLITAARASRWGLLSVGMAAWLLVIAALLGTSSRGGILAFAGGLFFFGVLVLFRFRSGRSLAMSVAMALLLFAGVFAFGESVLDRFVSAGGEQSTASRILIWRDAAALWRQAPLLGHGAGTFTSLFPVVQTIALDNQVVLHPESSWLQWLVEFGLIPLLAVVGIAAACIAPVLRDLNSRQSSFFLVAGSLAGAVTLGIHAGFDVPAHRWATVMIGLAALAIACPAQQTASRPRICLVIPAAIAMFWGAPFVMDRPAWSPTTLARLLDRARRGTVAEWELRKAVACFPLDPVLREAFGASLLKRNGAMGNEWAEHLQMAARLKPGSWVAPLRLARICRDAAPGHSLHFWQMALERAGWRRGELFVAALKETRYLPGATALWEGYALSHPELLLVFAMHEPANAKAHFDRWWTERGTSLELGPAEIQSFIPLAKRFASVEQIATWAAIRDQVRARDYREWATLLHARGADAEAWKVLAAAVPDPAFPETSPTLSREQLEQTWRRSPENLVNAQATAHVRLLAGDEEGMKEIILTVARRTGSPPWFTTKAAHVLAHGGRISDAVRLLLKERS